ncbi:MAG: L-alanine-DL-glutamate epimerase (EC [uncultured Sphingomonadaceae bacterium]|uniref:L-alanine-DL-glutamate epimerase (EC) n=1 Tax=uncultured Sphingomonadaceae bacterium TaxID=169976 RepID=A0A6J4SKH7_9SPHN|nr:MAG: L-alanine-DL-glutamate epimerase (EC [uncultured Sphingomonadaceae bacterium]
MPRVLTVRAARFPLARPFRIARGVKTAADVIVVELGGGDVTGRGEGVPYPRYGESVKGALAAVEAARALVEGGAGRAELLQAMPPGAARNAVDCALWDLEARAAGRDVAALLGAPRPGPLASALTIGLDAPDAMARAAAAVADAPLLKVKVDADDPEARLRAVRAAAARAALIVDPNESWDRPLVERLGPALAALRVDLLEQPVPAGEDDWLEGYVAPVPICADEAVHTAADLPVVARRYQAVNVKLDKAGGLTAALELAAAARGAGLRLMCGCMISSSLSIAPALHVARAADFVDLDGPLWLADDRPGGVRDEGGVLHPPAPGFWGEA